MSLKQKVKLEFEVDGETREVVTEYSAIDLRAWETAFGESALVADLSVSMLTWLGHHAAVRQGQVNGSLKAYKAFDEACVSVEGVRDEESPTEASVEESTTDADTPRAAGADSSAP